MDSRRHCLANLKQANSDELQASWWADCVEKLRISDVAVFRKRPAIRKSQMRFANRRCELLDERYKANLAEPLASKS